MNNCFLYNEKGDFLKRVFKVSLIVTLLDQIVKNLLLLFMNFGNSYSIIKGFFSITLIGNTGAAFSILSSNTYLLIIISIIILNIIYFYFIKNKDLNKLEDISYGLLIGGIMGNLIDRVCHMQVIDYLDFNIFGYNFPVFNLADIAIVISMFLITYEIIKGDKNEVSSSKR